MPQIVITNAIIEDMIRSAIFIITGVDILVKDEKQMTSITLVLNEHDDLETHGFAISGFPQRLLQDEVSTQTLKAKLSTLNGHSQRAADTTAESIKSGTYRRDSASEISINTTKHARNAAERRNASLELLPTLDSASSSSTHTSGSGGLTKQTSGTDAFPLRTNRFWTYIGPQHMASHPHLYSPEELQKFAGDLVSDITDAPVELPSTCVNLDLDLTLVPDTVQGAEVTAAEVAAEEMQPERQSSNASSDQQWTL